MESTDAALHMLRTSDPESVTWDAAAKYRELLQHQQRLSRECIEEDNMSSDGVSGSGSPRGTSDGIADEVSDDTSDKDNSSLQNRDTVEPAEFHLASDLHSSAAALAALQRQSLLAAASLRHHPASMVAQPGLDYRAAAFARDPPSPPLSPPSPVSSKHRPPGSPSSSSTGGEKGSGANSGSAPWNYEEQFKQLYEIDDNPKRKEFLDELFQFMQNRGTPINRLPIMAKQVLDLFELFNLVVARGGLVEVINKKLWQEIIKGLRLPSSITSAAFTLRTQYMKYLYPQECNKVNLSSPAELQTAIDGNRREGRRSNFSGGGAGGPGVNGVPGSYADLVSSSPFLACHMGPTFGMANSLAGGLHQSPITPISMAAGRAGFPASLGQPVPPSSPFLPGLGTPMLPSANDTLLTLWNMYSKQQLPPLPQSTGALKMDHAALAHHNQQQQLQAEALNLGVRKEETSSQDPSESTDRKRSIDWSPEDPIETGSARQNQLTHVGSDRESCGEEPLKHDRDSSSPLDFCRRDGEPDIKRKRISGSPTTPNPTKIDSMAHTKMKIDSKDDGSLLVSMEIRGCLYQGVLFAQSRPE